MSCLLFLLFSLYNCLTCAAPYTSARTCRGWSTFCVCEQTPAGTCATNSRLFFSVCLSAILQRDTTVSLFFSTTEIEKM
uniref:Secreted protein n=1 Tax=Monopterus albus TaxID=43700 RepID=A0A3Q3IVM3_MONAL